MRSELPGHVVETAYERGWSELENGELLSVAEADGFEIFVTTDRNLQYQQNLSRRRISIVVLSSPSWPRIGKIVDQIRSQLVKLEPGSYHEIKVP